MTHPYNSTLGNGVRAILCIIKYVTLIPLIGVVAMLALGVVIAVLGYAVFGIVLWLALYMGIAHLLGLVNFYAENPNAFWFTMSFIFALGTHMMTLREACNWLGID